MRALALIALLAATPAAAQQVWTAAPVPSVQPTDAISPAARAGVASAPDNDAPFSGIPTGAIETNGSTSANTTSGVNTPNLGK